MREPSRRSLNVLCSCLRASYLEHNGSFEFASSGIAILIKAREGHYCDRFPLKYLSFHFTTTGHFYRNRSESKIVLTIIKRSTFLTLQVLSIRAQSGSHCRPDNRHTFDNKSPSPLLERCLAMIYKPKPHFQRDLPSNVY